jgi:putative transposase
MKPLSERRSLIVSRPKLSIRKQCCILGIHRSGLYYENRGERAENLELMRLMDEHYYDHPYKGAPRMHTWLVKDKGFQVSRNRVDRLYYKVMGLRAIAPGPHTSKRCKDHAVFPYLLRDLEVLQPNQVWATGITYVPLPGGFMYLTAVIDLYSRYVLHWSISNTMEASWCKEMIAEAIRMHGKPSIINTDQGSQYTSTIFSEFVLGQSIKLSMDGKGRATDNAFIERLWRTVKYENIRFKEYRNGLDLYTGLKDYFTEYNEIRRHTSIEDQRPKEVFEQLPRPINESLLIQR